MKLFDIVNDISFKKQQLINDEVTEKAYQPFLINRAFSYYPDTILYAQEMNRNPQLDSRLQYDYLYSSIRKRNRFAKWEKKLENDNISIIQEYYGYSYHRALEAEKILTSDQISAIKQRLEKGGI